MSGGFIQLPVGAGLKPAPTGNYHQMFYHHYLNFYDHLYMN